MDVVQEKGGPLRIRRTILSQKVRVTKYEKPTLPSKLPPAVRLSATALPWSGGSAERASLLGFTPGCHATIPVWTIRYRHQRKLMADSLSDRLSLFDTPPLPGAGGNARPYSRLNPQDQVLTNVQSSLWSWIGRLAQISNVL